jgi:hypothetical protein
MRRATIGLATTLVVLTATTPAQAEGEGENARLAFKSGDALRVARKLVRQYFDRHIAAELRIPRAIHLSHPAVRDEAVSNCLARLVQQRSDPTSRQRRLVGQARNAARRTRCGAGRSVW